MCGLVGVAGVISSDEKKAFQQMLYADVLRGGHSTGVLFVDNKGETEVCKDIGPAYSLSVGNNFNKTGMRILMGHNRHATCNVNNIRKEHAHPFEFDNVIGMHNGTLSVGWERDLIDGKQFDIDSEALYNHLDQVNDIDKDFYQKVRGAMALSWWSKDTKQLEFLRNAQRPLHYTFSKDNLTMFWASEKLMLEWILTRNKIKFGEVKAFEINKHYAFNPLEHGGINTFEETELKPRANFIRGGGMRWTGGTNPYYHYTPPKSYKSAQQGNGAKIGKVTPKTGNGKRPITTFITDFVDTGHTKYLKGETFRTDVKEEVRFYVIPGEDGRTVAASSWAYDNYKDSIITCEAYPKYDPKGKLLWFTPDCSTVVKTLYKDFEDWDKLDYVGPSKEKDKEVNTSYIPMYARTYRGTLMMKSSFENITKGGCFNCHTDISWGDHKDLKWVGPKEPLCKECSKDDYLVQICIDDYYGAGKYVN